MGLKKENPMAQNKGQRKPKGRKRRSESSKGRNKSIERTNEILRKMKKSGWSVNYWN